MTFLYITPIPFAFLKLTVIPEYSFQYSFQYSCHIQISPIDQIRLLHFFPLIQDSCVVSAFTLAQSLSRAVWLYLQEFLHKCTRKYVNVVLKRENLATIHLRVRGGKTEGPGDDFGPGSRSWAGRGAGQLAVRAGPSIAHLLSRCKVVPVGFCKCPKFTLPALCLRNIKSIFIALVISIPVCLSQNQGK